jgi:methylmalonyl-CoA mutase cobalamin-binding domain/chain
VSELGVRRRRRALVVLVGNPSTGDRAARALAGSLGELGIDTTYLGREENARRVATAVVERQADALELCLARGGRGVLLLRHLLRELMNAGRRDVSIVIHRIE